LIIFLFFYFKTITYIFISISCIKYEEYDYDKFNYKDIDDEIDVCFASSSEVDDFIEKNNITYGKDKNDLRLRFIIGKCSPIILVPGIYSTKLQVKINCKDLMAYEWSLYEKIKVFCGKNVCSGGDKNDPDVTYDFWLNAMKKGFSLWRLKKDENNNLSEEEEEQLSEEEIKYENLKITWDRNNRYGACLGFFLTIFNNKDECPVINETKEGDTEEKITRICGHSQNIQISYGGGFINKDTNSSCGVSAVENVLYSFVNSEKANVFKHMTDYLVLQGYEKGFSLAAIPNDFRKFINTNTFVHDTLKYHVDRMYELTGKPVIIIAHSFGNLVTLDALTKEANNENFTKKIKHWRSFFFT